MRRARLPPRQRGSVRLPHQVLRVCAQALERVLPSHASALAFPVSDRGATSSCSAAGLTRAALSRALLAWCEADSARSGKRAAKRRDTRTLRDRDAAMRLTAAV
jgi:hypothetical protein